MGFTPREGSIPSSGTISLARTVPCVVHLLASANRSANHSSALCGIRCRWRHGARPSDGARRLAPGLRRNWRTGPMTFTVASSEAWSMIVGRRAHVRRRHRAEDADESHRCERVAKHYPDPSRRETLTFSTRPCVANPFRIPLTYTNGAVGGILSPCQKHVSGCRLRRQQ